MEHGSTIAFFDSFYQNKSLDAMRIRCNPGSSLRPKGACMKFRDTLELLLLSAIWGASFLLISLAAQSFSPAWVALKQAIQSARGARLARLAMVEGSVGLLVAPRGRLFRVLRFTFANGRIAATEVIGDPERLRTTEVGLIAE
jgi:hypothetical protein